MNVKLEANHSDHIDHSTRMQKTAAVLGSVSYLNARPLFHGVEHKCKLAYPVELARLLREGTIDAGLVPIVECLQCPEYVLVDGIGVGCDGPVASVFLAHQKPIAELARVGLDAASKTSVQLMKVVLEVFHHVRPQYVPEAEPADGRLWIGDPALAFRQEYPEAPVLDLGEAWKAATGLPFIFAVWAIRPRPGLDVKELADFLRETGKLGLAARHQIATTPDELHYLTKNIRYELGAQHHRAVALFSKHLTALGALPEVSALAWA